MRNRLVALWADRKVCWLLVKRDLRVRYSQSWLGWVWSVIEPLANSAVYFVIFGVLFGARDAGHQPYMLFLIIGLLVWQWFSTSLTDSPRALIQEQKLVKSTSLPREIWVVRLVMAKGIEFLLSLPVLVLFFTVYFILGQATLNARILLFPVAMLVQFVLQVGLGLFLAPVTVMVNDVQPLVRIFLRIFFYMCPVIFGLSFLDRPSVPEFLKWIYIYNPFSGILELYRAGFFPQEINMTSVVSAVVGAGLALVVGGLVFARLEKSVLKEI